MIGLTLLWVAIGHLTNCYSCYSPSTFFRCLPYLKVIYLFNTCKAQWSLYVSHSGHYMYRTVVPICIAQWSLMYRTMVTLCIAQWSLMYRTMVTICTAQWSLYVPPNLMLNNSTFCPPNVFSCFLWIQEQKAIISLHSIKQFLV